MMQSPLDVLSYKVNFTEPGEYKILLDYSCPIENSKQEGVLRVDDQSFYFETLAAGSYDEWRPLMFIHQTVALVQIHEAGIKTIKISPLNEGKELFKLNRIIVRPVL